MNTTNGAFHTAKRYSVVPQAHNMYYVTVQQLREIISVTT